MGAVAGLPDGRTQIRRAAFRIRQKDRPGARHRAQFGAGIREEIASADKDRKGRPWAPFFYHASRKPLSPPAGGLAQKAMNTPSFRDAAQRQTRNPYSRDLCLWVPG